MTESAEAVPATGTTGWIGAGAALSHPRWYWHPYNRARLYRLAEALARIPRPARLRLARGLGRLAPRFLPAERAAVRAALARITGARGARLDALTGEVFAAFAMCFSDLVSTNREPVERLPRYVASVSGGEPVHALTGGLVCLTAHVGNWELAGRLLARRSARPTHVVVAPDAPELDRWVRRDGDGMRFVARGRPALGAELLAALRRGEVVALQGDRALGDRGDVRLPFFGEPAPFPLGPFVLARAAGVPLVAAFCLLDRSHRYHLRVGPPIAVARGEEAAAARAWVERLEAVVREHPTQWFNFFDLWNPFGPRPVSPPEAVISGDRR
jgi:lauroyl/myristoyl acyltransferase